MSSLVSSLKTLKYGCMGLPVIFMVDGLIYVFCLLESR